MLRNPRLMMLVCNVVLLAFSLSTTTTIASVVCAQQPGIHSRNAAMQFAATLNSVKEESAANFYNWNTSERALPLLGIGAPNIETGFDQLLSYTVGSFSFPIFRPLGFDEAQGKYFLPATSKDSTNVRFIEFAPTGVGNKYVSLDGSNIELIDNDDSKTFRTAEATKFIFVRYPDDEFRCASIKSSGVTLHLLYAANGLALQGVVDSTGRSLTFNYGKDGIDSVTQTWMANAEGLTKTWPVGDHITILESNGVKYAHRVAFKTVPSNALVKLYTAEMSESDKLLARIFGGPTAVAGGNGFEPSGLGVQYPLYRGDIMGDDGKVRRGHLSHAIHLYGSTDGRGDSSLYIPAGFTSHTGEPSPTDAAVLFYYPRLGTLTDVTLAVFHVADFQISEAGDRVRIGNLGGPGGSSPLYKHAHIEFYRGHTSLPPAAARAGLRIDPSTIFAK